MLYLFQRLSRRGVLVLFAALCTCCQNAHALDAADVTPLGGDDFEGPSDLERLRRAQAR